MAKVKTTKPKSTEPKVKANQSLAPQSITLSPIKVILCMPLEGNRYSFTSTEYDIEEMEKGIFIYDVGKLTSFDSEKNLYLLIPWSNVKAVFYA